MEDAVICIVDYKGIEIASTRVFWSECTDRS